MKTYQYKIIVAGDGGVGKTTLILKYTEKRFRESYIPTIGVQWTVKNVQIGEDAYKLILWDVAGQDKFRSMRANFYEGSQAAIIVFDVTNPISFDHVENWIQEVQENCGKIPYIILGNKIDLVERRRIFPETLEPLLKRMNLPYFETSAKTGENVINMFTEVVQSIQHFQEAPSRVSVEISDTSKDIKKEIQALEELINKNETVKLIIHQFKTVTDQLFKENPYHEKLNEMSQWRLEKLNPYSEDATLSALDKDSFLEKIKDWKKSLDS